MIKKATKRKQNKGMTMVEVMMGFVILMLMLGALSGIIVSATNMFWEACDIQKAEEQLQGKVYMTNVEATKLSQPLKLVPKSTMPGNHPDMELSASVYQINENVDDVDVNLYIVK